MSETGHLHRGVNHVAIIGASLAGLTAAERLRGEGFDGTITVVDSAPAIPTDRPPLSKQVLAGTMTVEKAALPAARRIDDLDLELRLGRSATALSVADRRVSLDDGTELSADEIIIATGAAPRVLDTPLRGVHVVRDLAHSLTLRAELQVDPTARVVVVGAGFIGAEVAATCRTLGHEVTLIETQPWPLQRVLPPEIGRFIAELHTGHGVDVRLGIGVDELLGDTTVRQVRLTDGSVVEASVVVAGIGVIPSVGWLADSGLDISNGVLCDERLIVAPGISAIGDVARWPNPSYGGDLMRIEQWENAVEQGSYVARRIMNDRLTSDSLTNDGSEFEPHRSIPWFWSDQYDRKLQLAGRVAPDDEIAIVEGSFEEQRFVALFGRGDRCSAVLGVNRPRQVVRIRMQLDAGPLSFDEARSQFL